MVIDSNSPEHWLVAHRGDRDGGVENTLAAFKFAATRGARFAECDIQFTSDLIPVVLHDNWLKRLCNRPDIKVMQTDLATLRIICSTDFELLTLAELLQWLQGQPQLTMFIEIKPPIRHRLSPAGISGRLAEIIPASQLEQLVLISQTADIVDACKTDLGCCTGWVAESRSQPVSAIDYLFMPYSKIDSIPAWQARGIKVGLYTVNDTDLASELMAQNADLIETDHFSQMATSLAR